MVENEFVRFEHKYFIYESFGFSVFKKCVFEHCSFVNCDLDHVIFDSCIFEECEFYDSGVPYFTTLEFGDSSFCRCSFAMKFDSRSRFIDCRVSSSDFEKSEGFDKCSIRGSHFDNCRFSKDFDVRRFGEILESDILGWKKCLDGCGNPCVVKLLIPKGSVVFSINGKKCRTNHCKVLDIVSCSDLTEQTHIDKATSLGHRSVMFAYHVGDDVVVKDFDMDYAKECATGIHFFKEKTPAWNYGVC